MVYSLFIFTQGLLYNALSFIVSKKGPLIKFKHF